MISSEVHQREMVRSDSRDLAAPQWSGVEWSGARFQLPSKRYALRLFQEMGIFPQSQFTFSLIAYGSFAIFYTLHS